MLHNAQISTEFTFHPLETGIAGKFRRKFEKVGNFYYSRIFKISLKFTIKTTFPVNSRNNAKIENQQIFKNQSYKNVWGKAPTHFSKLETSNFDFFSIFAYFLEFTEKGGFGCEFGRSPQNSGIVKISKIFKFLSEFYNNSCLKG